ncbi:hypothetical protein AB1Y20_010934 [Prymnesium parvum]|uniref:Protein xylosyltransferase n=1 Tax=Prymnesium parvum TaxID=97485 RepID=A0AB34IR44_PRYPA
MAAVRALAVFIVFFGDLPPWLPLTLQSMAMNANVSFIVITDATAPALLPPNVHFEKISFEAMQVRLRELTGGGVNYSFHYKANDIKPVAAELYPHLAAAHEWWAWADLDVVFGDLLKFVEAAQARPACCRVPLRLRGLHKGEPKKLSSVNVYTHKAACPCTNGEKVNVICPLYPNPWRKKAWGPFTAFRASALINTSRSDERPPLRATSLFRNSPQWRAVLTSADYAHFDEWWGPFHYSRGWETMGDVLTRLAEDTGSVVMSKQKLPFAEAKTCRDGACMFCPCGALRLSLWPHGALVVNGVEVMILHLAESKFAWMHANLSLPQWSPSHRECIEISGLGHMNASCGSACSARAPIFTAADTPGAIEAATRLTRHRTKWAGHIKYATRAEDIRLQVGECTQNLRHGRRGSAGARLRSTTP